MIRKLIICLALLLPLPAHAEKLANKLFGAADAPSQQAPMPIGSYSRGCAAGLVAMPENGPNWQVMRLSRHRNFGHPVLVSYLQDLAGYANQAGWRGIYIGDMGQPRGGPMTSGHASHQIGLDVDVWTLKPKSLGLTVKQRESISSISIRTNDQLRVNDNWDRSYATFLKLAASDPRVDRIFVAAAIKLELCKTATRADKKWLQHIRPEAGHEDHFHIRLKCPKGARLCDTQKPTVSELSNGGAGCDETLDWWVSDAYLHPKTVKPTKPVKPQPYKKRPREFTMADLPSQCVDVLSSP
ncbi:MAG: penicillin-insensitive murein endopeptidase [Cypionkella sp.]|uniref:penicillin-insensitive murein endopeptidase n=1 Tax=Cypionkella sp. TaxID=2811411 RepID=UPI002611D02B|nr:penicillin-insensitive murein endopeptidase [Cypionkella sp.]MDB5657879.1 penicillin-insensitive murein endopeptidase [Cypionkella sp.]